MWQRNRRFSATLVIAQIVCMQCAYYAGLGVSLLALSMMFGQRTAEAADLLACSSIDDMGKEAYALNSLLQAVALRAVVGRTKQVMDFACTSVAWHWLFCALTSTLPSVSWLFMQSLCLVVSITAGEHLCARAELADIPLRRVRAA